ncbi:MAG: hypothetical protein OYH77_02920 [Pseudomonadota bacterium]|nr:hypothetical protein [Pseudomonadota bacterium]
MTTTPAKITEPTDSDTLPNKREGLGWLSMVLLMILFPLLFFLCVFIPIWWGTASNVGG